MTELSDAREDLHALELILSAQIAIPFIQNIREYRKYLSKLPADEFDRRLMVRSQKMGIAKAKSILNKTFNQADKRIKDALSRVLTRVGKTQSEYLKSIGVVPPSRGELSRIRDEVMELVSSEFPKGSGMSYEKRLERTFIVHWNQTKDVLMRTYNGDVHGRIDENIRRGLSEGGPGSAGVQGGSAVKKLQRLAVAEENRLASEMELRVIRDSGGKFGYWRLSGLHKWEGGSEICEIHADRTGEGVVSELRKMKINESDYDLKGLHLLSDWPDYPHPYCMCFPEPIII